jgi:hypothetical protein
MTPAKFRQRETYLTKEISSFDCVKLEDSGRVAQLVEQCPFKGPLSLRNPSRLTESNHLARTRKLSFGPMCSHSAVIVRRIVRCPSNTKTLAPFSLFYP